MNHREIHNIRRVDFSFTSRDQGWSGYRQHYGTYEASWTFFEASLTRPTTETNSEEDRQDQLRIKERKEAVRYELQRNRHAGSEAESYRHELGTDHGLLGTV